MHPGAVTEYFQLLPSPIDGMGVFAYKPIPAGTRMREMFWLTPSGQHKWIRGKAVWWPGDVLLDEWCWKFNHQKNCNCHTVCEDDIWYLVSTVDIKPGDELTVDYTKLPRFMDRNVEGFVER